MWTKDVSSFLPQVGRAYGVECLYFVHSYRSLTALCSGLQCTGVHPFVEASWMSVEHLCLGGYGVWDRRRAIGGGSWGGEAGKRGGAIGWVGLGIK